VNLHVQVVGVGVVRVVPDDVVRARPVELHPVEQRVDGVVGVGVDLDVRALPPVDAAAQ